MRRGDPDPTPTRSGKKRNDGGLSELLADAINIPASLKRQSQLPNQSAPNALFVPVHNFPFETDAQPLKQTAIVQPHHRLAGLHIHRNPTPL
jgi:hypothetical protein